MFILSDLTIIICTYGRVELLKECLKTIYGSVLDYDVKIIVVINKSDENLQYLSRLFPLVKFIDEGKVGLSNARNKGVKDSSTNWLFFLDDDAKLTDGSLNHIFEMIKLNKFGLCTGIWKAWYKSPPPKWLPHSTGNYILKGENITRDIGDDYVSGGVMLINKQKLLEIGGFPTHLGMTGNKVAYGEETYVEEEFKKRGWKVGINPNIVIDHLVGEHKYKLSWHLEAAYAKGRDTQLINRKMRKGTARVRLLKSLMLGWIRPLLKLLGRKNYFRQNFIINYIGAIKYYQGVLEAYKI